MDMRVRIIINLELEIQLKYDEKENLTPLEIWSQPKIRFDKNYEYLTVY